MKLHTHTTAAGDVFLPPTIIEAPITEQVRELHANDLASALLVHGICKPGQAAAMVTADRAKCERLILKSIANKP